MMQSREEQHTVKQGVLRNQVQSILAQHSLEKHASARGSMQGHKTACEHERRPNHDIVIGTVNRMARRSTVFSCRHGRRKHQPLHVEQFQLT
eukprot:12967039-Alexandrium_andersonii.AAC.2